MSNNLFRPMPTPRYKESWSDCLKRHCKQYGAPHDRVMELYQQLRREGFSEETSAREAAWVHGVTDAGDSTTIRRGE